MAKPGGLHSTITKNSFIVEFGALEGKKNKCSVELLSVSKLDAFC